MIVIKFHPGNVGVGRWAHAERGHASPVDIQGADWEEVQEESIIGLLGVCDVLGKVLVVVHFVPGWWVVDRE